MLDKAALRRLIAMQLDSQIDALVLLGTTGEPCTLTMDERKRIIEIGLETTNGSLPIIVGTGSNNTRQAIEYARQAEQLGAQGQLCVTPYYNKATQAGLIRHYHAILESCPLPLIVYNVPSRTGVGLTADTVLRLNEHPLIAGIKEASGDMSYAMKIARCVGPDFALYSGNDDITVPLMSVGGSGVISVYANVMPAMCHQIVADFLGGNQAQAVANHLKYLQLMNDLFLEVNPIPVKTAMNLLGLNVGPMRLPLCEMSEEHAAALRRTMEEAGLL